MQRFFFSALTPPFPRLETLRGREKSTCEATETPCTETDWKEIDWTRYAKYNASHLQSQALSTKKTLLVISVTSKITTGGVTCPRSLTMITTGLHLRVLNLTTRFIGAFCSPQASPWSIPTRIVGTSPQSGGLETRREDCCSRELHLPRHQKQGGDQKYGGPKPL